MRPGRQDVSFTSAVRRFLYWPDSWEYAFPWVVGPPLYLVLGSLGLPTGKEIGPGLVPPTLGRCVVIMILLLSINGVLLWTHMRPQFLTWGTAQQRFWGTFVLLTAIYLLCSGLILVALGRAGTALFEPARVDWDFTARCVSFGLLGLWLVLSVSAFWKLEELGVSNLRVARNRAITLMGRLEKGQLSAEEFRSLIPTLDQIEAGAETLRGHMSGTDLTLLNAWGEAAASLRAAIFGLAPADFEESRAKFAGRLRHVLQVIERTK